MRDTWRQRWPPTGPAHFGRDGMTADRLKLDRGMPGPMVAGGPTARTGAARAAPEGAHSGRMS